MIDFRELQAEVITKLRASGYLTGVVLPSQIKEYQYQAQDFIYPAIRVDMQIGTPQGNGTNRIRLSDYTFSVKVFSELDSSQEANRISGLVVESLFDKQIHAANFTVNRIDLLNIMGAVRIGERLFMAETFFSGFINDLTIT